MSNGHRALVKGSLQFLLSVVGVVAILLIEEKAIAAGLDGIALSGSIAVIGGITGYNVKRIREIFRSPEEGYRNE